MKFYAAILASAFVGFGAAFPAAQSPANQLVKRAVTTDGTCGILNSGGGKGYVMRFHATSNEL